MDTWETSAGQQGRSNSQWQGEDEEEDVLDSWDQDEEEEVAPPPIKAEPLIDAKKKKKDKEKPASPVLANTEMTAEEKLADKLYREKLQQEADLVLAKEMCGVSNGTPETKEDFQRLQNEIMSRVAAAEKNSQFVEFTEQLVQSLCLHMNSTDLKKIHNTVGNLHIEKLKLEKGDKAKKNKSKNKVKLRVDEETDYNEFSAYTTDEFDFI